MLGVADTVRVYPPDKAQQQACAGSLKALKADLKSGDEANFELTQADPELKRLFERVTSVFGISQTTAAEIIVTTNEFKSITDPKKFAASAVRLLRWGCSLRAKFGPTKR